MKEIGGYLELEELSGEEYYPDLIKLNLGRNALIFALEQLHIKKLWLPLLLCDSVTSVCKNSKIELAWYHIQKDFSPALPFKKMGAGEYLYIVNYYGQFSQERLLELQSIYGNILLDNTHAFFQKPLDTIPVLYSCRKFFGLPDGAYLSLGQLKHPSIDSLPEDSSAERMQHILGRYEHSASDYYSAMLNTAHNLCSEPVKRMSRLTQNLLKGIDYQRIYNIRNTNYAILSKALDSKNELTLCSQKGPFVYPLYCRDGIRIRKKMAEEKVFIPTYWSNVIQDMPEKSTEYNYAANILPLPCDQRYDEEDMNHILSVLERLKKGQNDI